MLLSSKVSALICSVAEKSEAYLSKFLPSNQLAFLVHALVSSTGLQDVSSCVFSPVTLKLFENRRNERSQPCNSRQTHGLLETIV
ncbi:unnamed protein product [Heterobilharzia americana]|nr:unnamed protein product [Heterobilharzia americana]